LFMAILNASFLLEKGFLIMHHSHLAG